MSKKYKGKVCVYCGTAMSSTRDHIFAREFFVPGAGQGLPVVPACAGCNGKKAGLEHYLTAVMPFGGQHPDARANLERAVPPRLNKNRKLHQQLASKHHMVWARQRSGILAPTGAIPLDFSQVEALFEYIVKGLIWFHWQTCLTDDHFIVVLALNRHGEAVFQRKFFQVNVRQRVASNLGKGTFVYEGVQGVDTPEVTAWRFSIYGGVDLGGDPSQPHEASKVIGAFTGPRRVLTRAALRAKFGP